MAMTSIDRDVICDTLVCGWLCAWAATFGLTIGICLSNLEFPVAHACTLFAQQQQLLQCLTARQPAHVAQVAKGLRLQKAHQGLASPMQQPEEKRPPRVLLAATGSVASIKVPQLCELLVQLGCEVKVASTKSALYFFKQQQLPSSVGPIAGDEDEWHEWKAVGDPVMHIELRRWADAYVIAPLSANTLAKLANGLCDNLVTCIARAWDFKRPLLVAPAMNTFMWESPFTGQHLDKLRQLGVTVVDPVAKKLACGDIGTGAMAAPEQISSAVQAALHAIGFNNMSAAAVAVESLVDQKQVNQA